MFTHLRQPDFTRLQTALFNGKPELIPLIELGIHPSIKAAILGRPIADVKDDIEFMASMGYDFVKLQPLYQFEKKRREERTDGSGQRDAAADQTWATEHDGAVQDWEDFEKYDWPAKENISYANFDNASQLLPDGMKIIGQYGDIFTAAWELMGFENFAIATFEEPELANAVLDKFAELVTSMFETMATYDAVGALWYSDDIAYVSSLMMSPDFYRESFFPKLKRLGAIAAERGVPLIYHSDGSLWEVFDDIIACGVKAQHPIEPKAMDIVEVKDRVGDKLCLCGNIEVDVLSRGTVEEVEAQVRERFQQMSGRPGWCIGSSNSVPKYAKVDNYVAMVKTALEIGR